MLKTTNALEDGDELVSSKTNQLNDGERSAIRRYVLFLVGIPAAVLGLLMFFLGYFIQNVAQEKASNEAFKLVSARYMDMVTQMALQNQQAKQTATDIEAERKKIEDIRKNLESVQILAKASANVSEIATAIRTNPEFQRQFGDITSRVTALESNALRDYDLFLICSKGDPAKSLAQEGDDARMSPNGVEPKYKWQLKRQPQ